MIDHYGSKVRLKFNTVCLKQSNNLAYDYESNVNIYIVYELGASSSNDSNPTLKNCLFGAVTLTKKQILTNMGILIMVLDLIEEEVFHFHVADFVKNGLIFGVDMNSSAHIDNKNKTY